MEYRDDRKGQELETEGERGVRYLSLPLLRTGGDVGDVGGEAKRSAGWMMEKFTCADGAQTHLS